MVVGVPWCPPGAGLWVRAWEVPSPGRAFWRGGPSLSPGRALGQRGRARRGGRAERALPRERERERERGERERERERQRERERERERTERGLRALTGTGGGLLQDRGSYRKNVWGIIFGGSTRKIQ